MSALRAIARALGGDVIGRDQVVAPGPGHSRADRSLSIKISATSPDGFIAHSHAGDDWIVCREYVKAKLGIESARSEPCRRDRRRPDVPTATDRPPSAAALDKWRASIDPRGTLVQRYLASRGLELGEDVAGEVLRWHPGAGCMVALFRDIKTDEPKAISRTFLDGEGRKLERKFLGPVAGCAIKLDAGAEVTMGLFIGEGAETCMAARQIGLRPVWALGSAGAISNFSVLSGIEALSFLRERDDANARAAIACGTRWKDAGREVFDVWPNAGNDVNDAVKGVA